MTYYGEIALKPIFQEGYFLNSWWISSYFDTKFTTVVQIEEISCKFEDPKFAQILNLKEVYFLETCVIKDKMV